MMSVTRIVLCWGLMAPLWVQAQEVWVKQYGQTVLPQAADKGINGFWSGGHYAIPAGPQGVSDFYLSFADTTATQLSGYLINYRAADQLRILRSLPGGGVLFGGNSWRRPPMNNSAFSDSSVIVIGALDAQGRPLFAREYRTNNRKGGHLLGLEPTPDGGYVFAAIVPAGNFPGLRLAVVKVSSAGAIQWRREQDALLFTGFAPPSALAVSASGDVIAGWNANRQAGGSEVHVVRYGGANGATLWERRIDAEHLYALAMARSDSVALYVSARGGQRPGFVMLEPQGAVAWASGDLTPPGNPGRVIIRQHQAGMVVLTGNQLHRFEGRGQGVTGLETYVPAVLPDFVPYDEKLYLFSQQNTRYRTPLLIRTELSDSVSNCFTRYFSRTFFPFQALSLPAIPFVSRDSAGITDSVLALNVRPISLSTKTLCVGIGRVWPGDANSDGEANVRDALSIGIAFGFRGPARSLTARDTSWRPLAAPNWPLSYKNGANYKQADCNGDGIVDRRDLNPILLNYRRSHGKASIPCTSAVPVPVLYLVAQQDSVLAGDTLHVDVYLGTPALPVDSLYGLSFQVAYNQELVDSAGIRFFPAASWLGTPASDMLNLQQDFPPDGELELALSRTDQNNRNGQGRLGRIEIFTIDDIAGKRAINAEALQLSLRDIYAVSISETELCFSSSGDSTIIYELSTISGISNGGFSVGEIEISPNPASRYLRIRRQNSQAEMLMLYDIQGRILQRWELLGTECNLQLPPLADGMYVLSGKAWSRPLLIRSE